MTSNLVIPPTGLTRVGAPTAAEVASPNDAAHAPAPPIAQPPAPPAPRSGVGSRLLSFFKHGSSPSSQRPLAGGNGIPKLVRHARGGDARRDEPMSGLKRRDAFRETRPDAAGADAGPAAPRQISKYYYRSAMPTGRDQLQRIRRSAHLAMFPYERAVVPAGWQPHFLDAQKLIQRHHLEPCGAATMADAKTGLTASVLHHGNQVVLALGGTSAGRLPGEAGIAHLMHDPGLGTAQLRANLASAVKVPESYRQASRLLADLIRMHPQAEVSVTGHSKGGGEAMYAALTQRGDIKATVFSPSHLSKAILKEIPADKLAQAGRLIDAYSVQGDRVPALRQLPGIAGVGVEHVLPPSSTTRHEKHVHNHVDKHLDRYLEQRGVTPPATEAWPTAAAAAAAAGSGSGSGVDRP